MVAQLTWELYPTQHGPQAPSVLSGCDNLIKITPFTVNHNPNMTPGIYFKTRLELTVAKLALEGKMSISVSVDSGTADALMNCWKHENTTQGILREK